MQIKFNMKRIIILVIWLILATFDSYSFWIWSPKKDKWLNSAAAYSGPIQELKGAMGYFDKHKYKHALKEFMKLIKRFPDSKEAAKAQYYIAVCFENVKNPYRAFLEYNKLVTTYPNSNRIQDAVAAEFRIGTEFLSWKEKRLLGVPLSLFEDHPSVEIFNKIVETSPYSEYAPRALYKLGVFLMEHSRNEEAKEAFKRLIDNYPDSEFAAKARYRLALAISSSVPGPDYDQSGISEAYRRLEEISLGNKQNGKEAKSASKEMKVIRTQEAEKDFDIASFYEKQNKFKSALVYYRIVVDKYGDTSFAETAKRKIEILKEVVE